MDDDVGTQRWQRLPAAREADPLQRLRSAIAAVRAAPHDFEARRRLRALAAEQNAWDQLALLLADESRAHVGDRAVAAAFYEELADVHENLDQPLEIIAALEAVVAIQPGEVEHHDRLAKLYHQAGAWQKAAEAFERVAALARDDRARAALRAAGRIYREHTRPERAIEVYRAIVARKPSDLDAWRALDELLAGLGRWREVADVRAALAEATQNPVEKAVLLRSQARALEQTGDTTAAAELVALATHHSPEDVSGVVDYASVLARKGKGTEAVAVLSQRIGDSLAAGAPADQIAALRLRLVTILDDAVGDRDAANIALLELLDDLPDYAPALERLVRHTSDAGDPRALAAALVRQADAQRDPLDRAAVLVEAARRWRDAGDPREAVRAYERSLEVLTDDADVRAELDDARGALAVQRAAADATAGDRDAAELRLRGLLDERPLDLAANLALVDLLETSRRLDDAAQHLRDTLANAPDDAPPQRLAPLVHRYAKVAAARGDADEAHQLLHEAHHLARRDLAITLALGESCYQRKLWREAAIHLGGLADHPEAHMHAAEVAAGLVLAARAEVRALRPANAGKHYEAAVRLDEHCAPAWHALGEAANERGELAHAIDCFEREAAGSSDARDRVRIFDAVADLALDKLGDPARAERCWMQIVDDADARVLHKLLVVQRKRGAGVERGQTCARLAELAADDRAKKELLEEGAEAFAAGGDRARARELAHELARAHPLDVDAIACASAVVLAIGGARRSSTSVATNPGFGRDHALAARWLRRALPAWDQVGERGEGDPRRADLWRRLGECERVLGDDRAALTAFQRAVATAPDSDGALAARRALVELAASAGQPGGETLAALVEAEQAPADVLAHARELARAQAVDDARVMYELAQALGAPLALEDEQFLDLTAPRAMASDEAYAAPLPVAELRALVDDDADAPLADLLDLVGEAASLVCPDARTALSRAGITDARRLSPTSDAAAALMYPQLANVLGGPPILLHGSSRAGAPDVSVVLASPPVVVLGPRLASLRAHSRSDADLRADLELRFRIGRAVELTRWRRVFCVGSEPAAFARIVAGLAQAFGPPADVPPDRTLAADAERLRQAIPVQLRKRLSDFFVVFGTSHDPAGYRRACERAADRSGLLACGHVGVAIAAAGGPEAARHLVQLAASPRYLAARRELRPKRA